MSSGTFKHTNIAHFCLVFMIPPALTSINYLMLISQKTSLKIYHFLFKLKNDAISIFKCQKLYKDYDRVEEFIYDVSLSKNYVIFMRNIFFISITISSKYKLLIKTISNI